MFWRHSTRKKGASLEEKLIKHQQVQLRGISNSRSEEVGYGRLLSNTRLEESAIISSLTARTSRNCKGKHILSIQDTSEFHYSNHSGRITDYSGLGDVGRCNLGYFMHPSLAIDAEDSRIIGLSDVHLWHRDRHRQEDTSSRKQRPIEEKESHKWISSSQRSQVCLQAASHITIIQDRDGDIFEEFVQIPNDQTDLLIRSRTDRKLADVEQSMYELVAKQPCCIEYEFEITTDNKKRTPRRALMEVRYSKVKIQRPKNLSKETYPEYVELTMVHAKEKEQTVPLGEEPVDWKLLSTHEVSDFTEAVQLIFWYTLRWLIEDFFRLLKKKGFDLESSEIETGYGLRKLGLFTMQAATRVMQLRQAREENVQIPIQEVFEKQEQACLNDILPTLEWKTEKLKNNHPPDQLIWATWIIARLGGWSGYESQRPPGLITLKNGLQKFNLIYVGWSIKNKKNESP